MGISTVRHVQEKEQKGDRKQSKAVNTSRITSKFRPVRPLKRLNLQGLGVVVVGLMLVDAVVK